MDSKEFDHIIKGKLQDYTDPDFDESALAGFHDRLATSFFPPWYKRHQNLLGMGSMLVLFTILNYWINQNDSDQKYSDLLAQMRNLQHEFQASNKGIYDLSIQDHRSHDTVFVIREVQTPGPGPLLASADNQGMDAIINGIPGDQQTNSYYIGSQDLISPDLIDFLDRHFIILSDNQGGLYLIPVEKPSSIRGRVAGPVHSPALESTLLPELRSEKTPLLGNGGQRTSISGKTSRQLDKHYHQGIGLRGGGQFDLLMVLPGEGTTSVNPGGGLVGEMMFSPSLSLESGLKVHNRAYVIDDPGNSDHGFPHGNPALSDPVRLESDSWVVEVPINLKYYLQLNSKTDLILSAGMSPNLYASQILEYEYLVDFDGAPVDNLYFTERKFHGAKLYSGTFNAGAGVSVNLPKDRAMQLSLYYQASLQGLGVEGQKIQIIGLNSSYWIRFK